LPDFMRGRPDPSMDKYVTYPMPLLSDIEMDVDGSMILAFTDRFSHQVRFSGVDAHGDHHSTAGFDPRLGGDILRLNKCDGINWTVENNATLCGNESGGKNNNQGIGGGEFYYGDSNDPLGHYELSVGSLAFKPGSREILLASTDPIRSYSAGVTWLSNEKGEKKRALEVIYELDAIINNAPVQYGKASSLGDMNMVCDISPLEIGNRLWRDDNGNGIQDAGEPGIAGVVLHLVNAENQIIGRDTTDINGIYAFNHFNVVDTIGVSKPNRLGPQPKTKYSVKVKGKVGTIASPAAIAKSKTIIGNPTDLHTGIIVPTNNKTAAANENNGGLKVDDSILGNANAGSGPDQDLLDSDGVIAGSDGVIEITTGEIGQSDHSYDFAYCPLPKLDLVAQKATCDPATDKVQNNASITLSNLQFAHKVGYSLGTTYTGPLFINAEEIGTKTIFTIDSISGSPTDRIYTVRVFNASDDCSRDIQVTIQGTVCTPCKITATAEASSIAVNNNGTPSDTSDDYFTVSVQANSVSSTGAAGLFEVVLGANPDGSGGTVLNTGGTAYGNSIKIGQNKSLKANSQPIKLTLRDSNKPTCIENVTVQADPYRQECKPTVCIPLFVGKN
nr:hypothetical protein [Arcicella sp.]